METDPFLIMKMQQLLNRIPRGKDEDNTVIKETDKEYNSDEDKLSIALRRHKTRLL